MIAFKRITLDNLQITYTIYIKVMQVFIILSKVIELGNLNLEMWKLFFRYCLLHILK